MSIDTLDDATNVIFINAHERNIFHIMVARYETWSNRIFVDTAMFQLRMMPRFVWCLLDICIWLLLLSQLIVFIEKVLKIKLENYYVLVGLILCYPISNMGSTGWLATTTNYVWVLATFLYGLNILFRICLYDEKCSGQLVPALLAILYATSYESINVCLIVILAILVGLLCAGKISKNPFLIFTIVLYMTIAIVMLIVFIKCPGVAIRSKDSYFDATYYLLPIWQKLHMGMVTAYLVFVSLPNAIFAIFCFLFMYYVGQSKGKFISVKLGIIPLVLDILWTVYYGVCLVTGKNSLEYQTGNLAIGVKEVALWLSIILLVVIVTANFWINQEFKLMWIFLIACIPELAVGFSDTVYTSMPRTTMYMNFAFIILSIAILDKIKLQSIMKKLLYAIGGLGIVMNVILFVHHVLVY